MANSLQKVQEVCGINIWPVRLQSLSGRYALLQKSFSGVREADWGKIARAL